MSIAFLLGCAQGHKPIMLTSQINAPLRLWIPPKREPYHWHGSLARMMFWARGTPQKKAKKHCPFYCTVHMLCVCYEDIINTLYAYYAWIMLIFYILRVFNFSCIIIAIRWIISIFELIWSCKLLDKACDFFFFVYFLRFI